jgi:hypothetical protein
MLLNEIKKAQAQLIEEKGLGDPLVIAYQNCWQKLDKWWRATDDAHTIYAAATLLSPLGRKAYFDKNWDNDSKEEMLATVQEYYNKYYKPIASTQSQQLENDPDPMAIHLGLAILRSLPSRYGLIPSFHQRCAF